MTVMSIIMLLLHHAHPLKVRRVFDQNCALLGLCIVRTNVLDLVDSVQRVQNQELGLNTSIKHN